MNLPVTKNEEISDKIVSSRVLLAGKKRLQNLLISLLLPVIVLIIWELLGRLHKFPLVILPPPEVVWRTFMDLFKSGEIIEDLKISFIRMLQGYALAVVTGLALGVLMGRSKIAHRFFGTFLNAIRQIPPLAWIPLIILWFGIGELSKVVIIFKAAFFPVLLNTIQGIENIPVGYLEVAKLMGTSRIKTLWRVILPGALPSIFVGLRLGMGLAWMTLVAAELVASSSGIGFRITEGRELTQPDVVIVGMVVIGAIGTFMDYLLRQAQRYLLRGQVGFGK